MLRVCTWMAAMADAAAWGPQDCATGVQITVRVASEIELVNKKLCDDVLATIHPEQSCAAAVLWPQTLAVQLQMVLFEMHLARGRAARQSR